MLREFVSMISLLGAVFMGGYAVILAVSTIFDLGGVSKRGNTLDADWETTGYLALVGLVCLGLYLVTRPKKKQPGADGAPD